MRAFLCAGFIAVGFSVPAQAYTFDIDLTQTYGHEVGGVDGVSDNNTFSVTALSSYQTVNNVTFTFDGLTFTGTLGVGFNNGTTTIDSLNFSGSNGTNQISINLNSFNLYGPISDGNTIGGSVTESLAATPLPATLPLFASGLAALGAFRWRKRRNAAAA